MITFAFLLALVQSSTFVPPPPQINPAADDEAPVIVVTARRLDATQSALAACIARNCPPDEEIDAAIAHAENQFVAGDYVQARRTLNDTIGRVDRHARRYPVPVSRIWRAESRLAAHLGQGTAMQSAQFEAIDALKAGLIKGDDRVLLQRLEVADTFIKQGKLEMGLAGYRTVIAQAREKNVPAIEGTALLRIALFDAALAGLPANALHPGARFGSTAANYRQAKKSIGDLIATTHPDLKAFREAGRLLAARLDAQRGDMRGIEAIAADYARDKPSRAVLLYTPRMQDRGTFFDPDRKGQLSTFDFGGQWIDVTFMIDGDGRVSDVELLRESPRLSGAWVTPILKTIAGRRYAPLRLAGGLAGMRRVERYTLTTFFGTTTGSRMPAAGFPRLEMVDLTADPDARPASS